MNIMRYKGYATQLQFDLENRVFYGRIEGITDIITFEADSFDTAAPAFEEAVDEYLDDCQKHGWEPNRPASGKMMLRINPETHNAAMVAAKVAGMSLNKWVEGIIRRAAKI